MGTFYSTAAWERKLAPYFRIERTVPRGLFGHQSFSIVRRRWGRPRRADLSEYARSLEKALQERLVKEGR